MSVLGECLLQALKKRLRQIDDLAAKATGGVTLNDDQAAKVPLLTLPNFRVMGRMQFLPPACAVHCAELHMLLYICSLQVAARGEVEAEINKWESLGDLDVGKKALPDSS